MGGIGKTTLARKIYHRPMVRRHFEGCSWVCISQQWQKNDVLLSILIKLMPEKRESVKDWRDEELVRELIRVLQGRKCLIVLDDIWSSDAWKSLESMIPIGGRQSKIIVTTRNMEVAKAVDAHGYIHVPHLLTQDQSWELLSKKAFHAHQDSEDIYKMKELGQELVVHCCGLPLALVVLGGILAGKRSYSEWEAVHKNVKSYLGKGKSIGQDEGDIQKILALSYDDLPYQLKPCFLYLSKYKEDEEIEVDTLYQMAEGMISSKDRIGDDETMMDVAERYLGELAERCMVFVDMKEEPRIRRFKSCRLHDLMRDMCIFKAKEHNFLDLVDYGNINGGDHSSVLSLGRSSCRLIINLPTEEDVERFVSPAKRISRLLRSFSLVMRDGYISPKPRAMKLNFGDLVMLRVLTLQGINPFGNEYESGIGFIRQACDSIIQHLKLPSSIGNLIHLRYLSLRDSGFLIIPSSISNLQQLQTLDLRLCPKHIVWIMPEALQKLRLLKHLYLPKFLRDFCVFLNKRRSLRLDGLQNLEILEGFDSSFCDSRSLSSLTNLRKLTARVITSLKDLGEFVSAVNNFTRLQFLQLRVKHVKELLPLDMIREIFGWASLTYLKLSWSLIKELPEFEVGFGQHLHSLSLCGCRMNKDPLAMLEKLPVLRKLRLEKEAYEGKEMTCHATGFPQLTSLELYDLDNLEKWEIEDGGMPLLCDLDISLCYKLEMIPEGLKSITTLQKLRAKYMSKEFNARLIANENGEEGPDFYKIRHVASVIT